MGLQDGTITHWLKSEGDYVEADEPLAEVEEAKVTDVIIAHTTGYLIKILVPEGETVRVRTPLCLIGTLEELQDQGQPLQMFQSTPKSAVAIPQTAIVEEPKAQTGGSAQVTPVARKLANEYKLDLTTIQGSGPGGRITEEDVRLAYNERSVEPQKIEIRLSGLRGVVAQRMTDSLRNSAQLTLTMQADVTELLRQREMLNASAESTKVTLTDIIVKATALTLKNHPRLNGWVEDDKIRLPTEVHIGVAVALEEGLIVPVLHNADRKALVEIAAETKQLAQNARERTLPAENLFGSTFTITNLGTFGVEFFTPIINPPEIAIMGVGAVKEYPLKQGDELVWRKGLPLSLTIDHRAIDGAPAALFLHDLKNCLEQIDLTEL
jgi:pyruvate dehydrogenase E2 component (dihydrolipoamide acetyltransferase)